MSHGGDHGGGDHGGDGHGNGGHGNGSDVGSNDHNMGGGHGMAMYFTVSEHATILFKGWMTMTWAEMLGSCIGILVLAILYEGLKVGRELLHNHYARKQGSCSSSAEDIPMHDEKKGRNYGGYRILQPAHFIQTLLYFVQLWLSLCLMLVFMTFNLYLCLAVTVGGAIGYYVFAWASKSTPGRENMCH